jgi:hypothetical protein
VVKATRLREGLRSLVKYSKLPIERVTYLPEGDKTIIKSIQRGILFLTGFWSGPSVTAFAKLTEIVAGLDNSETLELVGVDVDGLPRLDEVPEFVGKVHGAEETASVRDGKLVALLDSASMSSASVPIPNCCLGWNKEAEP